MQSMIDIDTGGYCGMNEYINENAEPGGIRSLYTDQQNILTACCRQLSDLHKSVQFTCRENAIGLSLIQQIMFKRTVMRGFHHSVAVLPLPFCRCVVPLWRSVATVAVAGENGNAGNVHVYIGMKWQNGNKKLSYCCDSRSYCMQYFNAIHCDRNISTSE